MCKQQQKKKKMKKILPNYQSSLSCGFLLPSTIFALFFKSKTYVLEQTLIVEQIKLTFHMPFLQEPSKHNSQ